MLTVLILLSCFVLQDAAIIKFVNFNDHFQVKIENETLNSNILRKFNEGYFGVRAVESENGSVLFDRPNVLVLCSIQGLEKVKFEGKEFEFNGDFETQTFLNNMNQELDDGQFKVLTINEHGTIEGTPKNLVGLANNQSITKKTINPALNEQLGALFKLETALKDYKKEDGVVQIYQIQLKFPPIHSKLENRTVALELLQTELGNVIGALRKVYEHQLLVEIYTHKNSEHVHHHEIRDLREFYSKTFQLAIRRGVDYPAMFLIVSGLIAFFSFAVIAAVIFMWDTQDMGKNSIIYRLTSNYKKKMLKIGTFLSKSLLQTAPRRLCSIGATTKEDEPIVLEKNPYTKEPRKCLLCSTGVELDYKNSRLLQQFVSTFSGRVYDRHITGLCDKQQEKLIEAIAKSRRAGYMPIFVKDPKYTRDPKLFDPLRPLRSHSFA
ncbi:unnamed protein product [Caenorhabditis angaria]|uniref:Renin receptor-like C-terminal transmembrane spanning segment domain-containing protein n=1 Tax=Caenorhabditis angaria TaxID=860376 RepID=A0A9P1ICN4_9PELO|nr:unnamed protein product [Caenorhabditis angaria]